MNCLRHLLIFLCNVPACRMVCRRFSISTCPVITGFLLFVSLILSKEMWPCDTQTCPVAGLSGCMYVLCSEYTSDAPAAIHWELNENYTSMFFFVSESRLLITYDKYNGICFRRLVWYPYMLCMSWTWIGRESELLVSGTYVCKGNITYFSIMNV